MKLRAAGYVVAAGVCLAVTTGLSLTALLLAGWVLPARTVAGLLAGAFAVGGLGVVCAVAAGDVLRRRNIPDLRDILSADTAHERAEDHQ